MRLGHIMNFSNFYFFIGDLQRRRSCRSIFPFKFTQALLLGVYFFTCVNIQRNYNYISSVKFNIK
jgi:hypothetical protein